METLNINWAQVADIGFLLLVTGISLRSLLVDRDALQKQRAVWKNELLNLEDSLRELISEATAASNAFDSKIQRRQKDLEAVLGKIETKVATITNTSSQFKLVPSRNEELIDPPWVQDSSIEDSLPRHLKSRLENTDASVYRSNNIKNVPQRSIENNSEIKSLIENIEIEPTDNDEAIFQQTSIIDPAAFKIAKRLLLEGKEIHVISRKLDIPVSEVRHLEMLLRKTDLEDIEVSPLKQKELSNVKKVIRDTSSQNKKVLSKEAQILESLGLGHYLDELDKETRI